MIPAAAVLAAVLAVPARAALPAGALDFKLQPPELTRICERAVESTDRRLNALEGLAVERRAFAAAEEFDRVVSDLKAATAAAAFLKYVSTDKQVREASHDCETKVQKYLIDVYGRQGLYAAFKELAAADGDLEVDERRLLEMTVRDFERLGQGLAPVKHARYLLLSKLLVEMKGRFGRNLSRDQGFLAVREKELAGLPEDYVKRLEKWHYDTRKVSLEYPDYTPFMQYAEDEGARRRLDTRMKNRAAPENVVLLEEILALRRRLAGLLGYPSYAAYVLEERVARKPRKVASFLKRMLRRLKKTGDAELAELLALKRERQPGAASFYSWDYFYYHRLLRERRYGLDDEKIREYFPLDTVLTGMFGVAEELFGVRITTTDAAGLWHPLVREYELRDTGGGEPLGSFYLDPHPRDGKYKHAAAFMLIEGRGEPGAKRRRPVSALVTNLAKPVPGRPALLMHAEVAALFHEFGHILHQLLARTEYARLSPARVPRDFIETPSNLFESWAWEPRTLRRISGHYRDGVPLPEETAAKLAASRGLNAGLRYLRQIFYATIDQDYHGRRPADTTTAYRRAYEDIGMIRLAPDTYPQAGFGYLMGYAAGYYGYMWSEVYAADLFADLTRDELYDARRGRRLRETLLEPGYGAEPSVLLRDYLGRKPDDKALLRAIGTVE
ncbi:MAG: M3 family metallopeptidase [Elusimicrobiota bacterium]